MFPEEGEQRWVESSFLTDTVISWLHISQTCFFFFFSLMATSIIFSEFSSWVLLIGNLVMWAMNSMYPLCPGSLVSLLPLYKLSLSDSHSSLTLRSWQESKRLISLPQGLCLVEGKKVQALQDQSQNSQLPMFEPLEQLVSCSRDFLDGTKTPNNCALLPLPYSLLTIQIKLSGLSS